MKKLYEISAVVVLGLVAFATTYFLLLPSLYGITEDLYLLYKGTPLNEKSSQSATISSVEASRDPATPSPAKTVPAPSGKNVSIPNPKPNIIFSSVGASNSLPVLTFGKKNTIVFRDVVTAQSIGTLQSQLIQMSQKLQPNEPIYLVLDTPGGSIDAGLALIDTARGLPQEVKTVTFFAASMGFHIVEALGQRLIVPSGTLMSHRAKVTNIEGQVPGEAVTRLNEIIRLTNEMDKKVANRIGMSLKDYQDLIRDEYWVQGEDSVAESMADTLVLARCGTDMNGTYTQTTMTLFGPMSVTWSECPLISAPLSVDAGEIFKSLHDVTKRAELQKFINTYILDKKEFTRKYIINQKYRELLPE